MTLTMFIIVIIIVVPGYLLINRFAKKFFFGDEKLERETENRYGFEKLEEKLKKEADQDLRSQSEKEAKKD